VLTVVLVPVLVVWAYATIEVHALAHRRGRRGVRSSALRARAALIVGTLFAGAAVVAMVVADVLAGTGSGRVAPLLALPAAAVAGLSPPRLSRLIQPLYADPWGPSDSPVRRAAADPALVVPARVALLGALVAGISPSWPAAAASYAFVAVAAWGMLIHARRRLARLARLRAGMLPRVLVRPPVRPLLTDQKPVGRTRFTAGVGGRRPDGPAGRRPCPYRTNATQRSPATS
jgi:hypothetical protein